MGAGSGVWGRGGLGGMSGRRETVKEARERHERNRPKIEAAMAEDRLYRALEAVPLLPRPDCHLAKVQGNNPRHWRIESRTEKARDLFRTWHIQNPTDEEGVGRIFVSDERLPPALEQIQAAGLTVYREES